MASVEGVVLAAGLSSRAEGHKMLFEIEGKTLIEKCILGMYDICSRIIVVGGYNIQNIAPVLNKYNRVEIVYNNHYQEGMFSSVKAGFQRVRSERFFFMPGDYPLIHRDVYEKMMGTDGEIVIPLYEGRKGHPVLMKRSVMQELFIGSHYSNLKDFINDRGYIPVEVRDPGILLDVDTQEDYHKIKMLVNEGIKIG